MTEIQFRAKKFEASKLGIACLRKLCKANDNGECQCLICSDFGEKPCPFYKERLSVK